MSVRSYGTPAPVYSAKAAPGSGGAPKSILKKTVWRYIDFMKLYRGISDSEYVDTHTAYENADGQLIQQAAIDFQNEVVKEAGARGLKPKDVIVEFEARAAAARLPSATGVLPRFSGDAAMPDLLMILVSRPG